jgi:hypothetical protein
MNDGCDPREPLWAGIAYTLDEYSKMRDDGSLKANEYCAAVEGVPFRYRHMHVNVCARNT